MAETGGEVFPGARIGKSDPRYPTLVRGFNLRWVGKPDFVQLCGSPKQVLETVRQAHQEGKRITVRSGGHCYEDFVCENEGGVIIDLSPMHEVYAEPSTGLVCIEGGATLWNVYNTLYREYGVTLPGGSCYAVGAGGHLTGGGYGFLSRLHGLTSDYLAAVELVRINAKGEAELLKVGLGSSDSTEQDMFWGHTGGGGGNFGIVTRFWFHELPQAPKWSLISSIAWDWEGLSQETFTRIIENFGDFCAHNSAPKSEFAPLFSILHLNQNAGRAPQITIGTQVVGDEPKTMAKLMEAFEAAVQANLPAPMAQRAPAGHYGVFSPTPHFRQLPWLYATQTLNRMGNNQFGKYKSAYMKQAFPPAQIETLWKHLHDEPNPTAAEALVQVDSYGCQVNAVPEGKTAVPQRSSVMKLQYQTYWANPEHEKANLDWIRHLYEEMYGPEGPMPDGDIMDGCFVNYPDVDLKNWQKLYYKDNYPRLQKAKAACDPLDVFHHEQSIERPK